MDRHSSGSRERTYSTKNCFTSLVSGRQLSSQTKGWVDFLLTFFSKNNNCPHRSESYQGCLWTSDTDSRNQSLVFCSDHNGPVPRPSLSGSTVTIKCWVTVPLTSVHRLDGHEVKGGDVMDGVLLILPEDIRSMEDIRTFTDVFVHYPRDGSPSNVRCFFLFIQRKCWNYVDYPRLPSFYVPIYTRKRLRGRLKSP